MASRTFLDILQKEKYKIGTGEKMKKLFLERLLKRKFEF